MALFSHSYANPSVRITKKIKAEKYPIEPAYRNVTLQGNKKETSRSNTIKSIEIR